ncbi:MAG: hypothetical protein WCT19_01615 [Candidatus Paceibacterota bacterium]
MNSDEESQEIRLESNELYVEKKRETQAFYESVLKKSGFPMGIVYWFFKGFFEKLAEYTAFQHCAGYRKGYDDHASGQSPKFP